MWYTNFHVQDVMPVISARPVVTSPHARNKHLTSDKSSHIYKHLSESPTCRLLNSPSSFKILDQASTEYDLKIKEAVYIQLHRPFLNKQVKHVNLKLSL